MKATSRSTVTVQVGNETRTFKDGDGVTFPKYSGGKRTFTLDRVEFAGYGLDAPAISHMDFRDKNVKGAAVVWLGQNGPRGFDADANRSLLAYRDRYVTDGLQAAALIGAAGVVAGPAPGRAAGRRRHERGRAGRDAARLVPDFTTTPRLDLPQRAGDHGGRRLLHVSVQPGARPLRRAEAPRRRAGPAAVVSRSTASR